MHRYEFLLHIHRMMYDEYNDMEEGIIPDEAEPDVKEEEEGEDW